MACFVKISQHTVGSGQDRKDETTWDFVNTTIAEEKRIMRFGFAPILLRQDELSDYLHSALNKEVNRFFKQGVFLTYQGFTEMNEALRELDLPVLDLVHDGNYSQPVLKGQFKPSKKAWEANGASRSKEFQAILQEEKDHMNQVKSATSLETFFRD